MERSASFAMELSAVLSALDELPTVDSLFDLRSIVKLMLSSDPARRPDSKSIQQCLLERLSSLTMLAYDGSTESSVPQDSRRNRFVADLLLRTSI